MCKIPNEHTTGTNQRNDETTENSNDQRMTIERKERTNDTNKNLPARSARPPVRPPNTKRWQQVEQNYLANLYVDDLPVYGPVGKMVEGDSPTKNEPRVYLRQRYGGCECACVSVGKSYRCFRYIEISNFDTIKVLNFDIWDIISIFSMYRNIEL